MGPLNYHIKLHSSGDHKIAPIGGMQITCKK